MPRGDAKKIKNNKGKSPGSWRVGNSDVTQIRQSTQFCFAAKTW
jgi:hypothetical protein